MNRTLHRLGLLAALGSAVVFCLGCAGFGELDLSASGRDRWQRPDDVVAALALEPGSRVADLGAGEGYFVEHLSAAVGPQGRVFAVEVEAEAAASLSERFPADSTNVETVLGEYDDPRLPDGTIDLVLIVNTFHHIENRPGYFRRLQADLSPRGRVAVIEPNEDLGGVLSLALDEGHKSSATDVRDEMRAAGYRLEAEHDFLPVQIFSVWAPEPGAG
jgi:predicted methyltransferase